MNNTVAAANANEVNGGAPDAYFLEAAEAAETMTDVESQQDLHAVNGSNHISSEDTKPDEETVSTFQDVRTSDEPNNCWILNDDDQVPFPSVNEPTEEMIELVNVCPCRCLFFTLKETICMVMSALGCAVFVTGLVFLCMFLEGSWFQQYQD